MAIKLGTQTAGVMLVTGDGDLSPIALLDTDPIDPVSRLWSISYFPDNLSSAPAVTNATSNPATFTPPTAGEWYVVRLVRTLLVGTQTLELPICVPDATGTYALPCPGIPADTDPTKTIVNLNDTAKAVGWAGAKAASLPGLSAGVRKAIADAVNGSYALANAQNVLAHGAKVDGSTDDTAAVQAAHDALPGEGGTLIISNTGTPCIVGALSITKPTRILAHPAGFASNGIDAVMFTRTAPMWIEGYLGTTTIRPKAGGTAVLFADNPLHPSGPAQGVDVFTATDVVFDGGDHHIDTFGIDYLNGFLNLRRVQFKNATNYAVRLSTSVYYGTHEDVEYIQCYADEYIKDNTETKTSRAIHTPAPPTAFILKAGVSTAVTGSITSGQNLLTLTPTGAFTTDKHAGSIVMVPGAGPSNGYLKATIISVAGDVAHLDTNASNTVSGATVYLTAPTVWCVGTHHVQIQAAEFQPQSPSLAPNVRVTSTADGANGMLVCHDTKFAGENVYWQRSDCYAIEIYSPGEPSDKITPQKAPWIISITGCDFQGPQFNFCTSIGRASGVSIATLRYQTNGFSFGHGYQIGDEVQISQVTDGSFNGCWPVTAIGAVTGTGTGGDPFLQTVTFTNAGADAGQSNRGGVACSGTTAAIAMISPAVAMTVDDNTFEGYANGIDNDISSHTGSTFFRDQSARCAWGANNHCRGFAGLRFRTFKSNRSREFTVIEPVSGSSQQVMRHLPRQVESIELRNRIAHSEALNSWANVGITVTTGQTDPYGGTRAQKLARTGANWILGDGSSGPGQFPTWGLADGEAISTAIDTTGTPVNGVISFWAKAGTAKQLQVFIYDGTYGYLQPMRACTLESGWTKYQLPFSYNPVRGSLALCMSPGAFDRDKGDCYVFGVQVSDVEADYYPSAGSANVSDTTSGMRLERALTLGSVAAYSQLMTDSASRVIAVKGGTPTITDVIPGLGTGGTYTLETGSNDYEGTVHLNTGTGGACQGAFRLDFSATFPGNTPTVLLSAAGGTATWGGGVLRDASTVKQVSSGADNAHLEIFWNNAKYDGTTGLVADVVPPASTSDCLRVHYKVIPK